MKLKSLFKKKKPAEAAAPRKKRKVKTRGKAVKEAPIRMNRNECPECGSVNVVISKITGNTICQDCGAILAGLPPDLEKKFVDAKKQG